MSTLAGASSPFPRTERRSGALELVASLLVAALLLFAAGAKVFAGESADGQTALMYAIVPLEVIVAIALVLFRARWMAWAGIAVLFGAFAGYSAFGAYWGETSCGCFGDLKTSPALTLGLDIAVAALAAGISIRRPAGVSRFGLILTAAGVTGMLGAGTGFAMADPRPEDNGDAATARLLALPIMEEVASRRADGPAWYLYIFNPDCDLCQQHLPRMQERERTWAESDTLRVRTISMFDLERIEGIRMWEWGTPPLTLLVQRGVVTRRGSGLDFLDPDALAAELADDPDPVHALSAIPEVEAAMQASAGGPAQLVYVYTSGCGPCEQHRREMAAFSDERPEDETLRIITLSREEIRNQGVDPVLWGELRAAYLVQGGQVTRTYGANEIPDPLLLWAELSGS